VFEFHDCAVRPKMLADLFSCYQFSRLPK